MWLCEPLWVSLTVENPFTINLEVLLSVLYGWRSLEATGRIRLKSRGKRLKTNTWEHQRTPDYREHWSIRDHPKASIPTLKPTTIQASISSRARHTMQILQQCKNIAHECQYTGCPKSHQTHRPISKLTTGHSLLALQREEIQLSTHQNTNASFPNEQTSTSQTSSPTHWEKPPQ